MTLVLAAKAGQHAVILAADSQGATEDLKPLTIPVRKLFVRNACGVMTFGSGRSVPHTIETKLESDADLSRALDFMEREFSSQSGVHSIVAGLQDGEAQIWHVNRGQRSSLHSQLGQSNLLYFNQDDQVKSTYPQAAEDHGVIISQMLSMLRHNTDNRFIGPPFEVLVVTNT